MRIAYLDVIKGIGILLVVFCHTPLIPLDSYLGNALMILAWSAVPCFMMVSGGLMHQPKRFSWKKQFSRIGHIYFGMCTWKVIYLLLNMGIHDVTLTKTGLFHYLFMFGNLDGVNTGVMWYMVAYLSVLFIYPITYYLFTNGKEGKKILLYMMALAFIGTIMLYVGDFVFSILGRFLDCSVLKATWLNIVVPFGNYGNMLFYFILGAFLLQYRTEVIHKLNRYYFGKYIPSVLLLLGIVCAMFVKRFEEGTFQWQYIYLNNGYKRLSTMMMSIGLYLSCMMMQNNSIIDKVGRHIGVHTMGIYYLHMLVLEIVKWYGLSVLMDHASVILNLLKTVVVTMICVVISATVKGIPILRKLVT